jgi:hypothetical protein
MTYQIWNFLGLDRTLAGLWAIIHPGALSQGFLSPLGEFADQTDPVHGLSWFSRPAKLAVEKFETVVIYDSLVDDARTKLERRNQFGIIAGPSQIFSRSPTASRHRCGYRAPTSTPRTTPVAAPRTQIKLPVQRQQTEPLAARLRRKAANACALFLTILVPFLLPWSQMRYRVVTDIDATCFRWRVQVQEPPPQCPRCRPHPKPPSPSKLSKTSKASATSGGFFPFRQDAIGPRSVGTDWRRLTESLAREQTCFNRRKSATLNSLPSAIRCEGRDERRPQE